MFEELASAATHEGELTLRRRWEPSREVDVYEVKLGDEYLMSSLFTVAEEELGRLALGAVNGDGLDVVVGGLGLGYTARAVLEDDRVRSLVIVEALEPVIEWHERGLLPEAATLPGDPRTRFVQEDFFTLAGSGDGFARDGQHHVDAIIVDIDHTPRHHLHPSHAAFYTVPGLRRLRGHLRSGGGVFALWSDDPPDPGFEKALGQVFPKVDSHVVSFPNFMTGGTSANTVYVAVLS